MWTQVKISNPVEDAPATLVIPPHFTRSGGAFHAIAIAAVAVVFLNTYAFKYFTVVRETYGVFWPRREWLFAHVLAGTIALMLGPLQFWLAWNRRRSVIHKIFGIVYVTSVGIGSVAALRLARVTDFGWVFGLGLAFMSAAWIITTALATIAICRGLVQQHREWMLRSYVVTFAFVTFRVAVAVLDFSRVGTLPERLGAASWLCWAVPLMLTEVFLQGRKILKKDSFM